MNTKELPVRLEDWPVGFRATVLQLARLGYEYDARICRFVRVVTKTA